jgi:dsDNA-specific endonuclease/ATPase MutS2
MNLDELWIGDWVRIINKNLSGTYEGRTSAGKAKVKTQKLIVLVEASNIVKIPDPEVEQDIKKDLSDFREPSKIVKASEFITFLDLHIEKLNPNMVNSLPERILDIQIQSCVAYVEQAIDLHIPIVTIIHGKGTGLLKAEVEHILADYKENIRFTFDKNNGGAVEVWFN